MPDTDRKKLKDFQIGQALSIAGITSAVLAVKSTHARARDYLKTGSENAATNVAELPMIFIKRASKLRGFAILPSANVASDNTDYVVFKFYKRTGATSTLIASWNTHGGAQGALTTAAPGVGENVTMGLVVNADGEIATAHYLTFELLKYGAGKAVAANTMFSFGLEEI